MSKKCDSFIAEYKPLIDELLVAHHRREHKGKKVENFVFTVFFSLTFGLALIGAVVVAIWIL